MADGIATTGVGGGQHRGEITWQVISMGGVGIRAAAAIAKAPVKAGCAAAGDRKSVV